MSSEHPETAMMRVLDLFSGIGGFSLGLERAGMKAVAFCEIELAASDILAQHWPGVPNLGDVTTAAFPAADISRRSRK
jgi:DNA (cytosine-5)-methyltransferase 1